jgi:hypothetical protein
MDPPGAVLGAQVASMIHEWPSHAAPEEPGRPVPQLSRAQKMDLARMAAACLLSLAALGGAAWVFACHDDRRHNERADLHLGLPAPVVTVRTTDVIAPETTPELRAAGAATAAEPRAGSAGRVAAAPSASAQRAEPRRRAAAVEPGSLPRRVARIITGDGRHDVRPFPTVPER